LNNKLSLPRKRESRGDISNRLPDLSGTEGLQDDDLILGDEIDLVDEDF